MKSILSGLGNGRKKDKGDGLTTTLMKRAISLKKPVDLTFYTKANQSLPVKQQRALDTTALRKNDQYLISKKVGYPQRTAIMISSQQENGGRTTPHGNGAYGLLGWRDSRAVPATKGTRQEQLNHIYDTVIDTNNVSAYESWTGGKKNMVKFMRAKTPEEATRTLNQYYIRPGDADTRKRTSMTNTFLPGGGKKSY